MTHIFDKLIFEGGFDERDAYETPLRGYRTHVVVQLKSGEKFPITFYDPVRLRQELEDGVALGNPFIAEPGLVVIPVVDLESMQTAARALCKEDFFKFMKPLAS